MYQPLRGEAMAPSVGNDRLCPWVDRAFWRHQPWMDHPENPRRLDTIVSALSRERLEPQPLGEDELPHRPEELPHLVHEASHVRRVFEAARRAPSLLDGDTYVSRGSLEAALRALAYSHALAVRAAEGRGCGFEFLLARPPGHHAGSRGAAMGAPSLGFCLFNNVALAARELLERLGGRVLVIDFDVHHGNGTQEIFYHDPRVVHVDLHQDPSTLYPGTGWPWDRGEGPGRGYSLNLVLPMGTGDDVFADAVKAGLEWGLEAAGGAPSGILVSAGFDAYVDDGLAGLRVTAEGFWRAGRMLAEASRRLGVPLLVFLEGGYTRGLERGARGFVRGILGRPQDIDKPTSSSRRVWERYREWKATALSPRV